MFNINFKIMKKILFSLVAMFIAVSSFAQLTLEDFQGGVVPAGWQTVTPTYNAGAGNTWRWHINDYSGAVAMRASAFSGTNVATEQWLITPSFPTTGLSTVGLSFDNDRANYPGPILQVFVSSDWAGDSASFASATWTEITGLDLSTGAYTIVNNTSDISSFAGNASVYVAFKYTSSTTEGAVWDVDNITVTAGATVHNLSAGVSIYPNPVSNTLNISTLSTIAKVQVLNVIGQEVMSNDFNAKNVTINTESLTNGVYFVKVTNTKGQSSVTKIVKK